MEIGIFGVVLLQKFHIFLPQFLQHIYVPFLYSQVQQLTLFYLHQFLVLQFLLHHLTLDLLTGHVVYCFVDVGLYSPNFSLDILYCLDQFLFLIHQLRIALIVLLTENCLLIYPKKFCLFNFLLIVINDGSVLISLLQLSSLLPLLKSLFENLHHIIGLHVILEHLLFESGFLNFQFQIQVVQVPL